METEWLNNRWVIGWGRETGSAPNYKISLIDPVCMQKERYRHHKENGRGEGIGRDKENGRREWNGKGEGNGRGEKNGRS